jgi:hypothetical protein
MADFAQTIATAYAVRPRRPIVGEDPGFGEYLVHPGAPNPPGNPDPPRKWC